MRKTIIVCMIAVGTWAPQPNQSSNKKNSSAKIESPSSVTFIDNEETTQAPNKTAESSPSFYTALKNPEWWLVLAALLTFYMIYRQAKEMGKATEEMQKSTAAVEKQAAILERQTKAVEDSVALQKTLKQQWLETENWQAYRNNGGTEILVSFRIINPTDMPLTLRVIEIYQMGRNETFTLQHILAPDGNRPFDFAVPIREKELRSYSEDKLVLRIFGNVSFVDNFGDWREQRIGHVATGGISGFVFTQFEGWLPSGNEENRSE
jgi:hypothetical protein